MAHHKSAEKRIRQRARRTARARLVLVNVRTNIRRLRAAVAGGDKELAKGLLRTTAAKLDKAASKGVMHSRSASRTISRLSRAVAKLG